MSLDAIRKQLNKLEQQFSGSLSVFDHYLKESVLPEHKESAINLLQYITLRKKNIMSLQGMLHEKGLSSLASAESHIHRQVQEILMRLGHTLKSKQLNTLTAKQAKKIMAKNTNNLFGVVKKEKKVAIMVTIDSEEHMDKHVIIQLIQRGMHIARINCAHDTPEVWEKMIHLIRKAEKETGLSCSIYMDLAGPKFRIHTRRNGKDVEKIALEVGESLLLTESEQSLQEVDGKTLFCQIPGLTSLLQKGNIVMIDDGMIEGIVTGNQLNGIQITIIRISGKPMLKSGKGINFPNTLIPIDSLTSDDISTLSFVKKHANLVGYSFVRSVEDLAFLHKHLYHGSLSKMPGLIIKVETPESVENLPNLLLYAMRYPNFGVMIARGDLAVEIGFERMSEIQEEILWLCEAAHTPVIWATQVLDQLNKTGIASRSEITDAYKAAQAECIMINKGKFTHLVLDTLSDIIQRSHRHHLKKRYEMQALSIAKKFMVKNLYQEQKPIST
jgi:pyruvate kinase